MRITKYRSAPDHFYVNSYFIEREKSVIVVDTQFILPEAEKMLQVVQEIGKPVGAVFLTHPHPDHVNGTGVLLREYPQATVYATRATTDAIAALAAPKREQWKPILGDAYPDDIVRRGRFSNPARWWRSRATAFASMTSARWSR